MQGHFRSSTAWLMGGVLALSLLPLPQQGRAATNPVTDVRYGSQDGAFHVTVVAGSTVSTSVHKFSIDSTKDVQDLVVDVAPATYDGRTKVIAFSDGPIRQVRVGQLSDSPAVMRIVVESNGAAKYDLHQGNGQTVTLALATTQQGHALDASDAATAARVAAARPAQAIDSGSAAPAPVTHTASAPAPVAHAAVAPPAPAPKVVAAAAPLVTARATPNPWLPGGKYYCKVPGAHNNATTTSAVSPSTASYPAAPAGGSVGATHPSGTVSIDVKNGDLLDTIRLLAQESGQNIVTTSSVKGTVSVSLHDVPLRQALDLIVRTNGLEYREVGNVYVVGTPDELTKQFGSAGQATQTVAFPIRYSTPAGSGQTAQHRAAAEAPSRSTPGRIRCSSTARQR